MVTMKAVKMEEPGVELKQLFRKEWGGGERETFGEEEVFMDISMSEREENERDHNKYAISRHCFQNKSCHWNIQIELFF